MCACTSVNPHRENNAYQASKRRYSGQLGGGGVTWVSGFHFKLHALPYCDLLH